MGNPKPPFGGIDAQFRHCDNLRLWVGLISFRRLKSLRATPMTIMAVFSGLSFLAGNPNPHYSPFEIEGAVALMRDRPTAAATGSTPSVL